MCSRTLAYITLRHVRLRFVKLPAAREAQTLDHFNVDSRKRIKKKEPTTAATTSGPGLLDNTSEMYLWWSKTYLLRLSDRSIVAIDESRFRLGRN